MSKLFYDGEVDSYTKSIIIYVLITNTFMMKNPISFVSSVQQVVYSW